MGNTPTPAARWRDGRRIEIDETSLRFDDATWRYYATTWPPVPRHKIETQKRHAPCVSCVSSLTCSRSCWGRQQLLLRLEWNSGPRGGGGGGGRGPPGGSTVNNKLSFKNRCLQSKWHSLFYIYLFILFYLAAPLVAILVAVPPLLQDNGNAWISKTFVAIFNSIIIIYFHHR